MQTCTRGGLELKTIRLDCLWPAASASQSCEKHFIWACFSAALSRLQSSSAANRSKMLISWEVLPSPIQGRFQFDVVYYNPVGTFVPWNCQAAVNYDIICCKFYWHFLCSEIVRQLYLMTLFILVSNRWLSQLHWRRAWFGNYMYYKVYISETLNVFVWVSLCLESCNLKFEMNYSK